MNYELGPAPYMLNVDTMGGSLVCHSIRRPNQIVVSGAKLHVHEHALQQNAAVCTMKVVCIHFNKDSLFYVAARHVSLTSPAHKYP